MSYVYKIKNHEDLDTFLERLLKFLELGYKELPEDISGSSNIYFKEIVLDRNDILVQNIIDVFNSKEWQKQVLKVEGVKKHIEEKFNIRFTKRGRPRVIIDDELFEAITKWRLEVDFSCEDGYIRFRTLDNVYPFAFYDAKQIMDKYCKLFINELLEHNLIELINL